MRKPNVDINEIVEVLFEDWAYPFDAVVTAVGDGEVCVRPLNQMYMSRNYVFWIKWDYSGDDDEAAYRTFTLDEVKAMVKEALHAGGQPVVTLASEHLWPTVDGIIKKVTDAN